MAAKVKKQYDFFGLKRKSVTFAADLWCPLRTQ